MQQTNVACKGRNSLQTHCYNKSGSLQKKKFLKTPSYTESDSLQKKTIITNKDHANTNKHNHDAAGWLILSPFD